MQIQVFVLMAHYPQTGSAQLPVGVVVRDPSTHNWASEMVGAPDDGGWGGRLAVTGPELTDALVENWQQRGNGVTWDLMALDAEGDSLESVLSDQIEDALRNWVILREEY